MCGFVFSYSIQGFGRLIHTGGVLLCQGRLIDELGNDMDSTATRLDFIQKRVATVMKKAGWKGQVMIIVFLIALLLILTFLVFSG
jgi:SYP6 family syntaxin